MKQLVKELLVVVLFTNFKFFDPLHTGIYVYLLYHLSVEFKHAQKH